MIVSPVHFREIEGIEDLYERMELTILLNRYAKKPLYRNKLYKTKKRTEN